MKFIYFIDTKKPEQLRSVRVIIYANVYLLKYIDNKHVNFYINMLQYNGNDIVCK